MQNAKQIFIRRRNELFILGCIFTISGAGHILLYFDDFYSSMLSIVLGYWAFPAIGIYAVLAAIICSRTQKSLGYLPYNSLISLSKNKNALPGNEDVENLFSTLSSIKEQKVLRRIRWCALLMHKKFGWAIRLLLISSFVMTYELTTVSPSLFNILFILPLLSGLLLFFLAAVDVT